MIFLDYRNTLESLLEVKRVVRGRNKLRLAFLVLAKFHSFFYYSIETWKMFSISIFFFNFLNCLIGQRASRGTLNFRTLQLQLTWHSNVPASTFFNHKFRLTSQHTGKGCVFGIARHIAVIFIQTLTFVRLWKVDNLATERKTTV